MAGHEQDKEREERIHMEIMPDAFGSDERAISWHNYLSYTLEFPFSARCIVQRVSSPLAVGDKVKVVGIAPDEECEREMFYWSVGNAVSWLFR